MIFPSIWFLGLSLVFCSSDHETIKIKEKVKLIENFEKSFNRFFYDNYQLSLFISQRDDILPILDFPETLYAILRSRNTLAVEDISRITEDHLKRRKVQLNLSDKMAWNFVQDRILKICEEFETSMAPEKVVEIRLIYPVATDFYKFYSSNDISDFDEHFEEKWSILSGSFAKINDLGDAFMKACCLKKVYHLFSDFNHFTELIRSSIFFTRDMVENLSVEAALFFISQSYECYFAARHRDISNLGNEWVKFVKSFSHEIENHWLRIIDAIDAINPESKAETKISEIEPPKIETLSTDQDNNNQMELKKNVAINYKILEKFDSASILLARRWRHLRIFEGTGPIAQFFDNELLLFTDKIKTLVKMQNLNFFTPKTLILSLDSLIKSKLGVIRFDPSYLEIFSEFVLEIYREEFFSQVNISRYQPEIKKVPIPLPEALLDNPSDFIDSVTGNSDQIEALVHFYSKFIESQFKNLNDSTAKDITAASIRELL